MSEFYGEKHRAFQDRHDTRRLADRLESLAHAEFEPGDRAFIEQVAFFFLSTVDERGRPTVSYKGGAPGFVRIVGASELVFPVYDGNGRIKAAAARVCEPGRALNLPRAAHARECLRGAVARAVEEVGAPSLTALHAQNVANETRTAERNGVQLERGGAR